MDQMANGHLGLGLGLNGRHLLHWSFRPWLKLRTQSQMADGNLKVPDLKVCVQNVKFIVFHMNFRKFPNFGKSETGGHFRLLQRNILKSFNHLAVSFDVK